MKCGGVLFFPGHLSRHAITLSIRLDGWVFLTCNNPIPLSFLSSVLQMGLDAFLSLSLSLRYLMLHSMTADRARHSPHLFFLRRFVSLSLNVWLFFFSPPFVCFSLSLLSATCLSAVIVSICLFHILLFSFSLYLSHSLSIYHSFSLCLPPPTLSLFLSLPDDSSLSELGPIWGRLHSAASDDVICSALAGRSGSHQGDGVW